MAESKIELKVEQEIKPIKELCEKMVSIVKSEVDKGAEHIDAKELGEVVDVIKDLSEAKKNTVEACYKMQIMSAMEEAEYGEDYDEEGMIEKRGYNSRRYANGRYAPKGRGTYRGYDDVMPRDRSMDKIMDMNRDMDRDYHGRMYYPESDTANVGGKMSYSDMMNDKRIGRAWNSRRRYFEAKTMGKDQQTRMNELDKHLNDVKDDIKELSSEMTPEERTMLKQKMENLAKNL